MSGQNGHQQGGNSKKVSRRKLQKELFKRLRDEEQAQAIAKAEDEEQQNAKEQASAKSIDESKNQVAFMEARIHDDEAKNRMQLQGLARRELQRKRQEETPIVDATPQGRAARLAKQRGGDAPGGSRGQGWGAHCGQMRQAQLPASLQEDR